MNEPKMRAPAARRMATADASEPGWWSLYRGEPSCVGISGDDQQHPEDLDLRSCTFGVNHIFDAHGQAMQRPALGTRDLVKQSSLIQHEYWICHNCWLGCCYLSFSMTRLT